MTDLNEEISDSNSCACWTFMKKSRHLALLTVALAILLDNMLLTTVVPIIPSFLYHLHHKPIKATAIVAGKTVPEKIMPITDFPLNAENAPQFLMHLPALAKTPAPEWDVPGVTVVPNEVFWKFTSPALQEKVNNSQQPSTRLLEAKKKQIRHQELMDENLEVGVMFASKPLVQAFTNPFVGPLSNKVGYSVVMFAGFIIMFSTTIVFALGNSYSTLFIARALQGIGSSCTGVAGMGMLAEKYPNDEERGNAMAFALGGLALGVLIGPVFGGTLYQFVGKAAPFLILAGLALIDGVLQLLVLQPKVKKQAIEDTPISSLLKDPYIVIAAGAITFSNIGIAVLEPSLPLWMMDTMNASKWEQGIAFLPASISYLIGTNLFGPLGHRIGRWFAAMCGLLIISVCLICVPMAKTVEELIPANAGIGLAIGMVDSSIMPMLGHLVDIRYTAAYGCVYAIADIAFCLGFIIGPTISASIVKSLGFQKSMYTISLISFLYAPLLIFLRNPPGKAKKVSRSSSVVKYTLFGDEEGHLECEALKKIKEEEQMCY